jgi:hypothetical protein
LLTANEKLKRLFADLSMENHALKELIGIAAKIYLNVFKEL